METEWIKLALASVPGFLALVTAIAGYATLKEKVRRMEMDVAALITRVEDAVGSLRKDIKESDKARAEVCHEHMEWIKEVGERLSRIEGKTNGTAPKR